MKYLVLISIICICTLFIDVKCDISSSSEEFLDVIKTEGFKQLEQAKNLLDDYCKGASENLIAAVGEVLECLEAIPDDITICAAVRSYTINCSMPIVKIAEDCLPEESKTLPEAVVNSVISAFDYICKLSGELIFELSNGCVYDFEDQDQTTRTCWANVDTSLGKFNEKEIPTKNQICATGNDFKSCLVYQTNRKCKNPDTKMANIQFFDAILAPCNV